MVKHSGGLTYLSTALDAHADQPLYQQLYREVRTAILNGTLAPGTRLPSSRMLAQELDISRTTVMLAYEQLTIEGYLSGTQGSGTYVSRILPDTLLAYQPDRLGTTPARQKARPPASLSQPWVQEANYTIKRETRPPWAFRPGVPELDAFPTRKWGQLLNKYWRHSPGHLLSYGRSAGYTPLCEAIAQYLQSSRGVRCSSDQVIIIAGSQQGLALINQVLVQPGDTVWLEDPGYLGARASFMVAHANIVPVPVDDEGINIHWGQQAGPHARLAFVTPSHQYPLGVTMSLQRRLALLHWASQTDAWIIEDDYDSEFRYSGRPLPSLQGLDPDGRVIYMGTFSKVLFPSLRLGYLVVPPDLVEAFTAARALVDQHSPLMDQAVLAEFMAQGHFSRHIRQMRALYAERQACLLGEAQHKLEGLLALVPDPAGMHLIGHLPSGLPDEVVTKRAAQQGIDLLPLSWFYMKAPPQNGLLLGYAAFSPEKIRVGVDALASVLYQLDKTRPSQA